MNKHLPKNVKGRRIIRTYAIWKRIGVSSSQGYRLVAEGVLPQPFKLSPGGRATGLFEDEIDEYLETCVEESRATAA